MRVNTLPFSVMAWLMISVAAPPAAVGQDEFATARNQMVEVIVARIDDIKQETGIAAIDPLILEAMARVPRHEFLPPVLADYAYGDNPLPLGYGQNISQPFIIALMTELLDIEAGDRVFETGTGAGYQAALMAELGAEVYSVEVVEPLARLAADKMRATGQDSVHVKADDGYYGWAENGPYDAILIKEALDHVPPPLMKQLKVGGRIVMPLGPDRGPQHLSVIDKHADGAMDGQRILTVRFSPLQGGDRI